MAPKKLRGILTWLIGTAIGMAVFLAFGQGSYLNCSPEPGAAVDCYLRKRTLFTEKEDKFSRSNVTEVGLSISTVKTQRSKSSKDYWTIRFRTGDPLELTLRGVAWSKGNMDFKSLDALLKEKAASAPRELRLVAYGMEAWFLGLLPPLIAWVLVLVAWAKPVTNVSADDLSRARRSNLLMLTGVTSVSLVAWILFFRFFEKYLAN